MRNLIELRCSLGLMPINDWGEWEARMERVKARLNDGRADVIADLKPHRHRDEAVTACVHYVEANRAGCAMKYRKRGLLVGSGVVESACKRIVGSRFKRAGCR